MTSFHSIHDDILKRLLTPSYVLYQYYTLCNITLHNTLNYVLCTYRMFQIWFFPIHPTLLCLINNRKYTKEFCFYIGNFLEGKHESEWFPTYLYSRICVGFISTYHSTLFPVWVQEMRWKTRYKRKLLNWWVLSNVKTGYKILS